MDDLDALVAELDADLSGAVTSTATKTSTDVIDSELDNAIAELASDLNTPESSSLDDLITSLENDPEVVGGTGKNKEPSSQLDALIEQIDGNVSSSSKPVPTSIVSVTSSKKVVKAEPVKQSLETSATDDDLNALLGELENDMLGGSTPAPVQVKPTPVRSQPVQAQPKPVQAQPKPVPVKAAPVSHTPPSVFNQQKSQASGSYKCQFGTDFERAVIAEINNVRSNPDAMRSYLTEMMSHFQGNTFTDSTTSKTYTTTEGTHALTDAMTFLAGQKPLNTLREETGLSKSCMHLCETQGSSGATGTTESSDVMRTRVTKYGNFYGTLSQNICYGDLSAKNVVAMWVIDDGAPTRPHRNTIFKDCNVVGIGSGPHSKHTRMVVAICAGEYKEHGSSSSQGTAKSGGISNDLFEETKDGKAFQIVASNVPGTHKNIKLLLTGGCTEVHLKVHDTAVQKWRLPFPFHPNSVKASFANGKLDIMLMKPVGSSDVAHVGDVISLQPMSNGAEEPSVNVDESQKGQVGFSFPPCKYLSDIDVTHNNDKVNFTMIWTFPTKNEVGQDVMQKMKKTHTITLPLAVTHDQIIPFNGRRIVVFLTPIKKFPQQAEVPIS